MKRRGKFLLAAFLGLSIPGYAQEKRLEVTGFFGGLSVDHDLGTVSNIFFTTTGTAQDVDFFEYYGFRAAFNFSSYVAIEGYLSRSDNTYSLTVTEDIEVDTTPLPLGDQFDAKQLSYGGNLIVQFPFEIGVVPFGTVGAGWQKTTPDQPIAEIESSDSLDFNFGGGVKYFFTNQGLPWLGARFDLRWHYLQDGLAFYDNEVSPRYSEITIGAVVRPF
jgi:hypothetical protein